MTDELEKLLTAAKNEARKLGDEVLADAEAVIHHIEHALVAVFRSKATADQQDAAGAPGLPQVGEVTGKADDDQPAAS